MRETPPNQHYFLKTMELIEMPVDIGELTAELCWISNWMRRNFSPYELGENPGLGVRLWLRSDNTWQVLTQEQTFDDGQTGHWGYARMRYYARTTEIEAIAQELIDDLAINQVSEVTSDAVPF